jgi:hypothetical protein
MTSGRGEAKHWLLTVGMSDADMHGYLLTGGGMQLVEGAANKMRELVASGGYDALPLVLVTPLDADGIELVRGIVAGLDDLRGHLESKECFCVFGMLHGPENEQVMALH